MPHTTLDKVEMRALADLAWLNECTGWIRVSQVAEDGGVYRIHSTFGEVTAVWQGQSGKSENFILIPPDFSMKLEKVLDDSINRIGRTRSATVLRHLVGRDEPGWRKILSSFQFRYLDSAVLMACPMESIPENFHIRGSEDIRLVEHLDEYRKFLSLVAGIFNSSYDSAKFFNPLAETKLFAYWYKDQPVSAAALWPFSETAGIYSLGTTKQFRRQGFAGGVLRTMLSWAKLEGFQHAVLRTTDGLIPFYAGIGFREVGRVARWIRFWRE